MSSLPADLPVDAAIAAALRRDVTIVVSPKDRFSTTQMHLERLRELAPGIRIIHTLCGPMPRQTRKFLEDRAGQDPDLELLRSGISFANPYALRNFALGRIRTKYTMFLFNDVVPQNQRWLAELYRCAEERGDADIFQPFIWEGAEAPHASWKSIYFLRGGDDLHCIHPLAKAGEESLHPSALPEKEQPFYLEDHAFMARTSFLAFQSIMDPGAAYAKEFLDMALSVRFRKSRIWAVPASQVLYAVPYEMQPGDLLYFSHRRSWSVSRGSIEYIQHKWGFRYWDDAYSVVFTHMQLASAAWTGEEIPAGRLEQVEMMLGIFTAVGYDRFEVLREGAPDGTAQTGLPTAHHQLSEALRKGDRRIEWAMRHALSVSRFPDFTADFEARRKAVRAGRLFPVVQHPRASEALIARGDEGIPRRFVLIEVEGISGTEQEVIETLKQHASLIIREGDAAGRAVYRAWLHGVRQKQGDIRDLAATLALRGTRSFRIAGKALDGAVARLHTSRVSGSSAVHVFSDASSTGWRLVHCAWKPTTIANLVALLR